MESTATPAKKKSTLKVILITFLLIGVTVTAVIIVRKRKKKSMIEGILMNGSSLSKEVLETMSYSDIKKLYSASTGVINP